MTVITVFMHEHKWGTVPDEPTYRYCNCGFFRRRNMVTGELLEPTRVELHELTERVNARLIRKQNARLVKELRGKGFYIPGSDT